MKKGIAFFLVIFILGIGAPLSQGAGLSIGDRFAGELVRYEVGFWVFPRVGSGFARLSDPGNGRFLLAHEGQARGLVGWLTHYRREVHRALMGTIDNGARFIPLRLEEESIIGDWVRKKTTVYDYAARKIFMETRKEGEVSCETVQIPQGTYYDNPLTAYYNLRYGVYGKVEPGREFFIPTIPRKGIDRYRVTVATREEIARRREIEREKKGKDLLVRIHLDQEFLGSPRGEIEIWFDGELNPSAGMIRQVLFFGEIRGRITQFGY